MSSPDISASSISAITRSGHSLRITRIPSFRPPAIPLNFPAASFTAYSASRRIALPYAAAFFQFLQPHPYRVGPPISSLPAPFPPQTAICRLFRRSGHPAAMPIKNASAPSTSRNKRFHIVKYLHKRALFIRILFAKNLNDIRLASEAINVPRPPRFTRCGQSGKIHCRIPTKGSQQEHC